MTGSSLQHAVASAYMCSLLSGPALAQLPPSDDRIRQYFRDADVVAIGRVTSLRVEESREFCCRVSFTFHVDRFLKGKDAPSFVYSFEARGGASEKAVRQYYAGEGYVFFYRRPSPETGERNSLWIALATSELLKVLVTLPPPSAQAFERSRTT